MENNQALIDQWKKLRDPKIFLRFILISFAIHMFALALGFAFLIITLGFSYGFRSLIMYWEPAYRLFVKVLQMPDTDTEFIRAPLHWYRVIFLTIKLAFSLYIIYVAIYHILLANGFLEQNLIYLLIVD